MIKNSTEWSAIETKMLKQASKLRHSTDVKKMIGNIRSKVTELSKAEVDARRGKKLRADELLCQVNDDIRTVEEYLLVAALLG